MRRTAPRRAARPNRYLEEISALRARAQDAEEMLRVLNRGGGVDAIVRPGLSGDQVFTLQGADRSYRLMVETMSEGAATLAMDGTILYCNRRFAEMVKDSLEKVIGAPMQNFIASGERRKLEGLMAQADAAAAKDTIDLLRSDGSLAPTYLAMRSLHMDDSQSIILVATDLSNVKHLEATRDQLVRIVESSPDGVLVIQISEGTASFNRRLIELWPLPVGMGETQDSRTLLAAISPLLKDQDALSADIRHFREHPDRPIDREVELKDGRVFEYHAAAMWGDPGDLRGHIWFFRDITERKQALAQIAHMAGHDNLTGLTNRSVFVEALQQAIARARRGGKAFAVHYLDLDHFKDINDTLGHPVGDLLLKGVAERLRSIVRETDTVARFGGDEFAVIEADIREPADAAIFASKLLKAISEPFVVQGSAVRSGTSVGIAVFGSDASDAETLLSHADIALYKAKLERRGTYRFFTEAMDTEVRDRVALEDDLREAIAKGQFYLVYQPQVDVEGDRIVGLEALVRWSHPTRGIVSPDQFIPVAERSGLIVALGHWILRQACRQMKEWLDAGIAPPLIAVNVSGLQFKTPRELEQDIAAVLAETGLPPQMLELELTESVLMEVTRDQNDVVLRLSERGIKLAIDDFGNGYSSLDYLSRFPVDRIKIAQNFVLDLPMKPRNAAIVRTAIHLGHELGLLVVVEGVETAEQLALIKSWGCRLIQGSYFSKPLPVVEVTALLRAGRIVPALSADGA